MAKRPVVFYSPKEITYLMDAIKAGVPAAKIAQEAVPEFKAKFGSDRKESGIIAKYYELKKKMPKSARHLAINAPVLASPNGRKNAFKGQHRFPVSGVRLIIGGSSINLKGKAWIEIEG